MPDEKVDPKTGMTYVEVGGQKYYVDNSGGMHSNPSDVVAENQRTEGDWSRGASGGCGQKAEDVSDPCSNATQDTKK